MKEKIEGSTLTWPRQIPLDGEPAAVVEEVRKNGNFIKFPKYLNFL